VRPQIVSAFPANDSAFGARARYALGARGFGQLSKEL
jgi:hypothetical protein